MPAADDPPSGDALPALPGYDVHQKAFQRAFAAPLAEIITSLPVAPGSAWLDAPCGGGFYTALLASRTPAGSVTALDRSREYLAEARRRIEVCGSATPVTFAEGDSYDLPFAGGSFDGALCAQSLVTLGEVADALGQLRRVLRPGGVLAVLEADEFHHILIPWPVEIEVAIARATERASRKQFRDPARVSPTRRLRGQLAGAGFTRIRRRTFAADFLSPFPPELTEFVLSQCLYLREFLRDEMPDEVRPTFDAWTHPESETAVFRQAGQELTCLNVLYTGIAGEATGA